MNQFFTNNTLARFWARVNRGSDSECWNWTGAKRGRTRHIAGILSLDGKNETASRLSWHIHYGPIKKGLMVCHKCDNPLCVNPKHLFLGTNSINQIDCVNKGRARREKGSERYNAKLSDSLVNEIRKKWKFRHYTYKQLASEYGVSKSAIFNIVKRIRWKHI